MENFHKKTDNKAGNQPARKTMEVYKRTAPGGKKPGGKKPGGNNDFMEKLKRKLHEWKNVLLDWMDHTVDFLHTKQGKVVLICAGVVLVVIIATITVLCLVNGGKTEEPLPASGASSSGEMVDVDENYDPSAYEIDTDEYASTILPATKDAGQTYVDETLFLGDSNTARFELYKYCTMANNVGSVSMGANQIASFKCVKFTGYNSYLTMVDAMPIFQPKRVVITFGTNNLAGSSTQSDKFIAQYQEGIKALYNAYPYCDIIVNSIPPLGQHRSNTNLSQTQIDAWNQAIVEMCKTNGWKYLNSAEVLKDTATGWAKEDYTLSTDGVHLSTEALDVLFDYVRTHAYETQDRRPTPLNAVPVHTDTKNVAGDPIGVASGAKATAIPTASPTPEPTEEPTPEPTEKEEEDEEEPTPTPTEKPTPTPTEKPSTRESAGE